MLFVKMFFYISIYALHRCTHMCMPGAHAGQKRALNLLELSELLATMWDLGIKQKSCGRATRLLTTDPSLVSIFSFKINILAMFCLVIVKYMSPWHCFKLLLTFLVFVCTIESSVFVMQLNFHAWPF